MNDITTGYPLEDITTPNSVNSSSSNTTSSSPCLPSSSNFTFSSVEDILQIYPSVMKDVLTTYKIKNCYIKNGYCSQSIDNTSGCLMNTEDPSDSQCSCDCLLFPLNLMNSLNNTIYCILTNTSSTNYVFTDQTIIFSIMEEGGNISNADINTSQTANVKCISLSSNKVQESIADLSYNVILNIIQQAKTQPSLFSCPISQDFLTMYENYGKDDLNNLVQSSVTSVISSFVQDSQTINIALSQIDYEKLSANITQSEAITILSNNIVSQSFNKINQSVLGQHFDDIMSSFNDYCFPPPTTSPPNNIKLSSIIEETTENLPPPSTFSIKKIIIIVSCIIGGGFILALIFYNLYTNQTQYNTGYSQLP